MPLTERPQGGGAIRAKGGAKMICGCIAPRLNLAVSSFHRRHIREWVVVTALLSGFTVHPGNITGEAELSLADLPCSRPV
jgi:hypothetical protein